MTFPGRSWPSDLLHRRPAGGGARFAALSGLNMERITAPALLRPVAQTLSAISKAGLFSKRHVTTGLDNRFGGDQLLLSILLSSAASQPSFGAPDPSLPVRLEDPAALLRESSKGNSSRLPQMQADRRDLAGQLATEGGSAATDCCPQKKGLAGIARRSPPLERLSFAGPSALGNGSPSHRWLPGATHSTEGNGGARPGPTSSQPSWACSCACASQRGRSFFGAIRILDSSCSRSKLQERKKVGQSERLEGNKPLGPLWLLSLVGRDNHLSPKF